MKKHLDVLLALVALIGLVNGLGGGASGRTGAGGREGPGAVAPAGSPTKVLKTQGGSPLPERNNGTSQSNSTLGLGGAGGGGTSKGTGGGGDRGTGGGTGGGSLEGAGGSSGGSPSGSAGAGTGGGTGRGARGRVGRQGGPGGRRSGALGAEAATAGSRTTSNRGSVAGNSVSDTPSGFDSSVARGERGSRRRAGGARGQDEAPNGGSRRETGSGSSPTATSSGRSGIAEGPQQRNGVGSSIGNRDGGGSDIREAPGLDLSGSSTGPGAGRLAPGLGSPMGAVGPGAEAIAARSRGLGGERSGQGLGFGSAFGESGDYSEDNEGDLSARGSSRWSAGFGGSSQNGGFGAGGPGFGAFGPPFHGPSIGGLDGAPGASARGGGELGRDELLGEEPGFITGFGANSRFNRRPGSGFPSIGTLSETSGFEGDFGAGSPGRNWGSGAGDFAGSTADFDTFSVGRNNAFGRTAAGYTSGLGSTARLNVRPGPSGGVVGGDDGAFPEESPQQVPGPFSDSGNGPGGSAGWPTRENFNDLGSSGLDSSRGLSSPVASGPQGIERAGLFRRLRQRRREGRGLFGLGRHWQKPDPRLAAAIAVGTLAGATAISGLGAGIAAAVLASRTRSGAGLGARRRLCGGRCRDRDWRINMGLKAAENLLSHIPRGLQRQY